MPRVPASTGLGEGLTQLGSAFFSIAMRERQNELKKADVALADRIRDLAYGNPEQGIEGYLSTQNDQAVDNLVTARQAVATAVETLKEGLSDDAMRRRFDLVAGQRVDAVFKSYSEHALTQQRNVEALVSEARINSATLDAVHNPSMLSSSLSAISSEVAERFAASGVGSPEVVSAGIVEAHTTALVQVIDALMSRKDYNGAQGIIQQYGHMMDGPALAKAELGVAAAIEVNDIQQIVDEIATSGRTDREEIDFIAREYSGELYNKVVAAMYNRNQMEAAADAREHQDAEREFRAGERERVETEREEEEARADKLDEFATYVATTEDSPRDQAAKVSEMFPGDAQGQQQARTLLRQAQATEEGGKAIERAIRDDIENERVLASVEFLIRQSGDPEERRQRLEDLKQYQAADYNNRVVAAIHDKLSQRERQEEAANRASTARAFRDAGPAALEGGFEEYTVNHPLEAEKMDRNPQLFQAYQAASNAVQEGRLFIKGNVSDGETYVKLMTMPAEEMLEADPTIWRTQLTQQEWGSFFANYLATQAAQAKAEGDPRHATYSRGHSLLDDYRPSNIDVGPSASEDDRAYMNFARNRFNLLNYEFIQANNRDPSQIETEAMVAEASLQAVQVMRVENDRFFGFFDRTTEAYKLSPDQLAAAVIPFDDITDSGKSYIRTLARAGNRYPDGNPPQAIFEEVAAALFRNDNARILELLK